MSATTEPRQSIVYRVRAKLGGYHPVVRWYRQHRPTWWWLRVHAVGRVTARFVKEYGLTVRRGPFEGLRFPEGAVGHVGFVPAKLLGSYESAVVATLADLGGRHSTFVDIGSGEGSYCVGMARLHPDLQVIGYETTAGERELAAELARLNGVTFDQRATAERSDLRDLPDGTLMLVDIEGYESVLLDPAESPRLREVTMVVELHDPDAPGIEGLLRSRFDSSHAIRLVHQHDVQLGPFPELQGWTEHDTYLATTERPGDDGVWMVLEPKG